MSQKVKVAIIGSGNIGTDLMIKIMRTSSVLDVAAMVGVDPASDGLSRAQRMGIEITSDGIDGLVKLPAWNEIKVVFDATSAYAHKYHDEVCRAHDKTIVDLTPAAIGPYTVPVVNSDANLNEANVNMVTCGGQATIPIVHAVSRVAKVHYAEIIASIASKSAGPGTRANIDEFTETTSRALEQVGGATKGKAIIVLNPAEPPMIMRDTVFTLSEMTAESEVEKSIERIVDDVRGYVPGYRLKQKVQFERFGSNNKLRIPGFGEFEGLKTSVFLEVEGAGHYLPAYSGNLDIMTSAALSTGERIAFQRYGASI
jgi:acetaldehyde dehydrogenase